MVFSRSHFHFKCWKYNWTAYVITLRGASCCEGPKRLSRHNCISVSVKTVKLLVLHNKSWHCQGKGHAANNILHGNERFISTPFLQGEKKTHFSHNPNVSEAGGTRLTQSTRPSALLPSRRLRQPKKCCGLKMATSVCGAWFMRTVWSLNCH